MTIEERAAANKKELEKNIYPGRGIILGANQDKMIQVYWIMGRSPNSRNRIFLEDEKGIKTKAFDESRLEDPSLIIYYPAKTYRNHHIITNGDQTDTIYRFLSRGRSFEEALSTRGFEPDAPNFTPRISGIMEQDGPVAYELSILKTLYNDEAFPARYFYKYKNFMNGFGHCITTYDGDGTPLPSFTGEPLLMPLEGKEEEILETYWKTLNEENRISLLVKSISRETGKTRTLIKNKLG